MPKLTEEQKEYIRDKADYEGGLAETLLHYSNFSEYKDTEFNKMVKELENIFHKIEKYLGYDD